MEGFRFRNDPVPCVYDFSPSEVWIFPHLFSCSHDRWLTIWYHLILKLLPKSYTFIKFYLLNVAVSIRRWQHFVALSIKELAHLGIIIAQYRLLLILCNPLHCCLGLEDYLLWSLLGYLWLFKSSNFPQRWCKDVSQSTFKTYRVKKNVVVWVVSVINRLSWTDASLENFHYW